jgi:UDP-glucose 4-epimerase
MQYIVTGGAGYIGSHMVALLIKKGYKVCILDNFSNSNEGSIRRLESLCGPSSFTFYHVDITDKKALCDTFDDIKKRGKIEGVYHFAGLKAVGESNQEPLKYYLNNVAGTLILTDVMKKNKVFKLIFSSSATVYGDPDSLPIKENARLSASNPYGQSKLTCEQLLEDIGNREPLWRIAILRYFNPVGAHSSGVIGEKPNGTPNNLMPYVFDVALGKLEHVNIFGCNYDTPDGTGVRDYIHVEDLVEGHLCAHKYLENNVGVDAFNLGTGKGYSVLEMIECTRSITGKEILIDLSPRRSGDVGEVYASTQKAEKILKWKAKRGIHDMIKDHWAWTNKLHANKGT